MTGKYRKVAREILFRTLYMYDFRKNEDLYELLEEVIKDIRGNLRKRIIEYAYRVLSAFDENKEYIDDVIRKYLQKWRFERLGYPERAFLRLGTTELLFSNITDKGRVFIDILDLAKCYLDNPDSLRFINGVLSSIYNSEIKPEEDMVNHIDIEEYIKKNFNSNNLVESKNENSNIR